MGVSAAVLTVDCEGIIRSASQNLCRLFGYTAPEQVVGKHLSILLCPPPFLNDPKLARKCHRQLPCGSNVVVGWRANGRVLSLRLTISELNFGCERYLCCLVAKLKDESRVFVLDGSGQIISCNKQSAKMFGYKPCEMVGLSISTICANFPIISPSTVVASSHSLLPPANPGICQDGVLPDGRPTVLRGLTGKHRDGSAVVFRVDVTEVMRLGAIHIVARVNPIDKEHDAFLIVDRTGKIQKANEAVCKMFGYKERHLVGANVAMLMARPPLSMAELCSRYHRIPTSAEASRRGSCSPGEALRVLPARHKNGSAFYIYLEVNEFREKGETLYLVKLSRVLRRHRDAIATYDVGAIKPDTRYVGHYFLQETIVDGLYGKVKKGIHELTNETVVVKVIEKDKLEAKRFREIDLVRQLDHPNIVKLLEVVEAPGVQYIVFDMIEGGELYDLLCAKGRLTEDEARKYWRQLVSAVDYMHSKRVVHRDLKLENLMLDRDGNIVVIDFGLGTFMTPGKLMKTFCGSVAYAAPEMFMCQNYVGPPVDIWSMGVILYCLVLGYLPFEDPRRVVRGDYIPLNEPISNADESFPLVSEEFVDLIDKLFQRDPLMRITMEGICNHPWTNKNQATMLPCMSTPAMAGQPCEASSPASTALEGKDDILKELVDLGFEKEVVVKSIEEREFNAVTASFYLLNKRKNRQP